MLRTKQGTLGSRAVRTVTAAFTLALLFSTQLAQAAGLSVDKRCDNDGVVNAGEIINCEAKVGFFSQGFNFTRILPTSTLTNKAEFGFDTGVVDEIPFLPLSLRDSICVVEAEAAPTDFPIAQPVNFAGDDAIKGNARCSGAACNPVNGAGCSLPCLVCEATSTTFDPVTGLSCPGGPRGEVHFRHQNVEDCRIDVCPRLLPNEILVDQIAVDGLSVRAGVCSNDATKTCIQNADCGAGTCNRVCSNAPLQSCTTNAGCVAPGTCQAAPGTNPASAQGTADITCVPAECPCAPTIEKKCDHFDENGDCIGEITVTVKCESTATNPPPLTKCNVVDTLDPGKCSNDAKKSCVTNTDCGAGNTCNGGNRTPVDLFTTAGTCSNDATKSCFEDTECGAGNSCNGEMLAKPNFSIALADPPLILRGRTGPLNGTTLNRVDIKCDPATGADDEVCPVTASAEDPCECGDSYKCYAVKPVPRSPRFPGEIVSLEDQFRTTEARLLSPYEICNPADKNDEGIANPDAHLMCYKFLDRSRTSSVPVRVTDQFGTEDLRTSSANVLCVPALKNCDPQKETCSIGALEEELNHFQCYGALPLLKDQTLLTPDPVQLVDQFTDGLATFPTSPRRHLCTPTAKNGGSIPNEAQHLKCYNIRDEVPFRGTDINVIDQFGTWELRVGQARELCESAEKTRLDRRPVDDTRSR